MTAPDPFPHPEWPDVLDAEAWAAVRRASEARRRTRRVADYFHGARAAR